ncbi:LytTR family DNA-binding domain-containing protein [Marinifilum breve]|nr:LytTR family DNA-binding domain-containing protein [Marinifilum breve]
MKKLIKDLKEYLVRESLFGYLMHNTYKTLIFIFIGIFCILMFFQPYILSNYDLKPQLILTTGISFLGCLSYAFSFLIFSPHNKKRWTKFLEIGLFGLCFLTAWLSVWLYTVIHVNYLFEQFYGYNDIPMLPDSFFIVLFIYTIGIGLLLYLIIHSFDIFLSFEKQGKSDTLLSNLASNKTRFGYASSTPKITLKGKNENELLDIDISQFIAAKSDGHYIKVFYLCCNKEFKQFILRNSMANIEQQLINVEQTYRCHKSYIINLNYLKSAYTNSIKKTSFLRLLNYSEDIPVSPKKIVFIQNKLSEKKK